MGMKHRLLQVSVVYVLALALPLSPTQALGCMLGIVLALTIQWSLERLDSK